MSKPNIPKFQSSILPALIDFFKYASGSHSSTDAHRHKTISNIPALHFIEQHRGQLGSGATQRMAYRNRPAVDIHNV
jgi:hypothetical protein